MGEELTCGGCFFAQWETYHWRISEQVHKSGVLVCTLDGENASERCDDYTTEDPEDS